MSQNVLQEVQNEIIEEFAPFDDWMDRYALLIDMGNSLEPLPEEYKIPQNIIEGCQSRVWIKASLTQEGKLHLLADSDALIVKGIAALLLRVFNNQDPKEILSTELFFLEELGLKEHLSPTRSNGLLSMIGRILQYARVFTAKG